jgi:hypothetical protein
VARDQLGLVSKHNYLFPLLTISHTTTYIQHVIRYYLGVGFSCFLSSDFLERLWMCAQVKGVGGMQHEQGTWIIVFQSIDINLPWKATMEAYKTKEIVKANDVVSHIHATSQEPCKFPLYAFLEFDVQVLNN